MDLTLELDEKYNSTRSVLNDDPKGLGLAESAVDDEGYGIPDAREILIWNEGHGGGPKEDYENGDGNCEICLSELLEVLEKAVLQKVVGFAICSYFDLMLE